MATWKFNEEKNWETGCQREIWTSAHIKNHSGDAVIPAYHCMGHWDISFASNIKIIIDRAILLTPFAFIGINILDG
jgi:hypothetical protein